MANDCGFESVGALIDATVPPHIRKDGPLELGEFSEAFTEGQYLAHMKELGAKNKLNKIAKPYTRRNLKRTKRNSKKSLVTLRVLV